MADGPMNVSELPDKGPADDMPLSFNDGVNALADFLDDQDEDLDPVQGHEEQTKAEEPTFIDDEEDTPVDEDGEESEDDEQAADEDEDGSDKPYEGGRFASDNAKVTLEDGTVITVSELKRNNLFQRDYSKKTEELARTRETVETRQKEVEQAQEQTTKEREYLLWFAQQYAPQPPVPPDVDATVNPMAWIQYQQAHGQYQQLAANYQQMVEQQTAATQAKDAETQKEAQDRLRSEAARLTEKFPVLKNPEKGKIFWDEIAKGGKEYYGLDPEQLFPQLNTAETVEIFRDALRYRAAKAKAPAVQKDIAAKPHLVQGSRRVSPQQKQTRSRNEKVQRLKETGSPEAFGAYLMDQLD